MPKQGGLTVSPMQGLAGDGAMACQYLPIFRSGMNEEQGQIDSNVALLHLMSPLRALRANGPSSSSKAPQDLSIWNTSSLF